MTARAASAHAMLQKMVGSGHYAVRVPIPSDFGIGTVSCVHVYAYFVALRARSFVVYRPVRFSSSDICTIVHSACDMWGAQSHTSLFCPKRDKMRPAQGLRGTRDIFPQSGTVPPKAGRLDTLLTRIDTY